MAAATVHPASADRAQRTSVTFSDYQALQTSVQAMLEYLVPRVGSAAPEPIVGFVPNKTIIDRLRRAVSLVREPGKFYEGYVELEQGRIHLNAVVLKLVRNEYDRLIAELEALHLRNSQAGIEPTAAVLQAMELTAQSRNTIRAVTAEQVTKELVAMLPECAAAAAKARASADAAWQQAISSADSTRDFLALLDELEEAEQN